MTVLAIGIFALVAGFSSGYSALNRSEKASSAATVAEVKMESYRALKYDSITATCPNLGQPIAGCALTPFSRYIDAADGNTYHPELAIGFACAAGTFVAANPPTCSSPASDPIKVVKIVVRNRPRPVPRRPRPERKILFRQSSAFAKKATG